MIQVRGFGDKVETLFEKVGIAYAVHKAQELGILPEDCKCEERKEKLNNIPILNGGKRKNG